MTVPFAFDGSNAADIRPVHQAGTKPWARDPSAPGASDGTRISASFLNVIAGNLRAVLTAAGVTGSPSSDTLLLTAVQTLIADAIDTAVAALPADRFLQAAAYDDATNVLTLTLSDATTVPINLTGLIADAVADRVPLSQKGAANGVATLGADVRLPDAQSPQIVVDMQSQADAAKGAALIGYKRAVAGAQGMTLAAYLAQDSITPDEFTGATDTDKVQAAINYALSQPRPEAIFLDRMYSVAVDTLTINRPVDGTTEDLVIYSHGGAGGLRAIGSGAAFKTTTAIVGDPVSQCVVFRNFNFEEATDGTCPVLVGNGFLRVRIEAVNFHKTRIFELAVYAQSIYVTGSTARNWTGLLGSAEAAYDVCVENNMLEHGAAGFDFIDGAPPDQGNCGIRLSSNLYEGCSGAFAKFAYACNASVDRNYFEGNEVPEIEFHATKACRAPSVTKNYIALTPANAANANFYPIIWGASECPGSGGNFSTGNLHDISGLPNGHMVPTFGDYATLKMHTGAHAGGFYSSSRTSTGSGGVVGITGNKLHATRGVFSAAMNPEIGGFEVVGPYNAVDGGLYAPHRILWGPANPQTSPGTYGSPYWSAGSFVLNSGASPTEPYGRVCLAAGAPGTWLDLYAAKPGVDHNPVPSSTGGAFTAASSVGRVIQHAKLTTYQGRMTIATKGAGASGLITLALPVNAGAHIPSVSAVHRTSGMPAGAWVDAGTLYINPPAALADGDQYSFNVSYESV